jgi:hypothetical protein
MIVMTKPELLLARNPTVEDLVALFKRLTGREPTPDDLEATKAMLAERAAQEAKR